jgi:hypothetical protein
MERIVCYLTAAFLLILFNSCEKELSVSPEEKYPSKNGIIVSSAPEGSYIYINGKNTGYTTPDTVFWINSGKVLVTLKNEMYRDSSVFVNLNDTDTISIFMDFISNPTMRGKLRISSFPEGGEIFLNDSAINKTTPTTLTGLIPGYYKVRVRLSGYWDEEKTVLVKSVVTTYVETQMIDTLTWIHYSSGRVLISDYLTSIAIERGHIKWIGSLGDGLYCFDDQDWKVYNTGNSIIPDDLINSVSFDTLDNLWICTNLGVVKKNGDNWTLYNTENSGLPDNQIITASSDGTNICFGSWNKGLFIFDGANWITFNKSNSPLPSNTINKVVYKGNSLWVCTYSGLVKIEGANWSVFTDLTSGFPNNNPKSIAFDRLNRPWVVFGEKSQIPGGSAFSRTDNNWESYIGIPSTDVNSIFIDRYNVKWFGNTKNGLAKSDLGTVTNYNTSNSGIRSNAIFGVVVDQNDHKWLASYGAGLIKYKGI